jgi:hypothetical protein
MTKKKRLKNRFKNAQLPKIALGKLESSEPAKDEIIDGVPRITNDTIAEHREEVLGSARKYIYPLQHSKHRIVLITTSLFVVSVVAFFSYCTLALYKFKSRSGFLYGVTQVIPFPVGKAGSSFVAYENYLFELRHYTHYYQTQQKLDFNSDTGKQQLAAYKQRALDKVVNDAYVKQLAKKSKVSVSGQEVENQITVVRNQNRLGASDKGLEDVLKDNFGWSLNDFRRSLKQQMLAQKVVAARDTDTNNRAKAALAELQGGADFAGVAKKYSDDTTNRDNGGEFGFLVDKSNRDLPAKTTDALFALKPGQISGIINNGYSLEILRNIDVQGDKIHAAHILLNFKDISVYTNELKDKEKPRLYIKL